MDRRSAVLLFYDLPAKTKKEKRKYREFRKFLISEGYLPIQESVYVKLLQNGDAFSSEKAKILDETQEDGRVYVLCMSLATFEKMECLRGAAFDFSVFRDDYLVF